MILEATLALIAVVGWITVFYRHYQLNNARATVRETEAEKEREMDYKNMEIRELKEQRDVLESEVEERQQEIDRLKRLIRENYLMKRNDDGQFEMVEEAE